MNALPNISNSLSNQTAPVTGTNPMRANMLSANQTSAHPLFMGSANLPTRELAARTLTLPPLTFSSMFETNQTSQQKPDITLAMGEFKIGGIDHTEHELTSVGKQAVFPSNHAPESWLSNDMNPLYMGPSPSLRNSHFIGGGADETMLSFLPDDLSPATLQNLSRESLKKFEQIRDSYTTEIQTIKIKEKDGSSQGRTIDVTVRKFNRPDPKTYLTASAIENHLSLFKEKPCLFLTRDAFDKFCKTSVGRPDGQFLIPKDIGDRLEQQLRYDATFAAAEAELGIPTGAWRGQEIIRVTINTIPNLRMASGNESGANKYWMPGGYLPNGLPEAVCDQIPLTNISKTAFTPN